ncbi:MAG: hypothetical protein ABSE77_14010 [Acidimicrobiales bacterium]
MIATSAILSFGGIGLFLADMGHYSAGLVLPIGIAGTATTALLARPRAQERVRQRRRSWSVTALGACVVALGQLAWNATNMSRHVVGDRDPGVIVLTGKWLAEHGSLVVPATTLWSGTGVSFSTTSAGVYTMPDGTLQFQFAHMMSVLLAEAGVRDAVLIVVLESTLPLGQAFTVAIASRVMLIAGDIALAIASILLREILPGGSWSASYIRKP